MILNDSLGFRFSNKLNHEFESEEFLDNLIALFSKYNQEHRVLNWDVKPVVK